VIPKELPGVTVSTLDIDLPRGRRADVAGLVDPVLEELLATPANTVAALRGARRYAQVLRAVTLPEGGFDLPQGAVVLITGGFGGIGLTIAEDLIRRNGARIILIARRSLPDRATWARHLASHGPDDGLSRRILALQRLEALGGQVLVQVADVCNADDMRAAVAAGEATFGAVQVVIHAAGVVDDGPLLAKTPAQVEEVFAPKLHGTQVLAGLFPDGKLDLMVLFSSTSTVTGPAGQIDYVAANEYLNAYAKGRTGKTRVVALNWGIWTGVGMAAEALADRTGRKAAPAVPIKAMMLDEAGFDAGGNRQFTARYGMDRWVLDGHRTAAGQALIPGTGYLEVMAEAMAAQGEAGAFDIRDLYFFRALDVADLAPKDIRATLARSDEGYAFSLQSAVPHQGRTGWQTHATARLIPVSAKAPAMDIAAIAARLPAPEIGQGLASPQEAHLRFGPRWRVLNSRAVGAGEGLAHLALPEAFRAGDKGWLLHPALMDLATGWAMDLIAGYAPDHLWVPVSYAQVRVHAPLPAEVVSHVRNAADNRAEAQAATFDITLAAPDGQVCVEIQGFTIRKLEGALAFAPPAARDLAFDDGPAKPTSPAEERLLHSFSQGIRPDEGAQAFRRAVALGAGQIIVSSLNLPDLVAQTAAVQAERAQGAQFERPDLENAYVAPRNDVERTLVGFWQELLGVGQVGVEDSFFDLGGHSLIAVRLFAMVKKAYRVDFPISVLFEAPTIARCAALITDRIGVQPDQGAAPVAVLPARRFTHLVAMHQGEGGAKTPFFLVAGMFGNVLNLRHLAQLIGGDRPFYGLQARGLYGDDVPHQTFPDAARDYIAEMRQVQPQGPYLLGGFSGGGLIAWDIARQLEAAGEEVRLVALLDTPIPMRPVLSRKDKALIKLAELRAKGPGYLVEWYRARAAWKRAQAEGVVALGEAQFDNAAIEAAFRAALPVYDMQPRAGATVLFRPPLDRHWQVSGGQWVSKAREYVFHDNDLTQFAPSLRVIEVPGDHDSMVLEPNVRTLAARLKAVIAEAEVPLAEMPLARAAE
jgi:thioesterase domain-containing protein/NAD(P)-dependent dehydrogenase (short-subunit alcohol dehydrogenase family)/acyl carrier protein